MITAGLAGLLFVPDPALAARAEARAWPSPSPHPRPEPPRLSEIVRRDVLERVDAREVMTHAELEDMSPDRLLFAPLKERVGFLERHPPKEGDRDFGRDIESYDFYVGVRVHAPVSRVREVLTDYRIYKKLIPYVEAMEFTPRSRILSVEGGIWRFKIRSRIRFEERGDRWLGFRIIGGHFRGLEGEMLLEPLASSKDPVTRVWLRGQSVARRFPPEWVIEQGAQVVFGYTAGRLRSFIESGRTVDQEVPELPARPMGASAPERAVVPAVPLVLNPSKSAEKTAESQEKSREKPKAEAEKENPNVVTAPEPSGTPVPRPRRSL